MFYRKPPEVQQRDLEREPTEFETQYASKPGSEPTCFEVHETWRLECDQTKCRNWMDYGDDLNCAVVCARKYENGLSLREVADRMGVSFPRISQIEHAAFRKLGDAGILEDFKDFEDQ